jgi:hypothetical protein
MQSKKIFFKNHLWVDFFPILLWHSIRGDFLEIWNSADQHLGTILDHLKMFLSDKFLIFLCIVI